VQPQIFDLLTRAGTEGAEFGRGLGLGLLFKKLCRIEAERTGGKAPAPYDLAWDSRHEQRHAEVQPCATL